jgi:hypothetical protein
MFVLGSLGFLLGGDAVAGARFRAGDPRLRALREAVDGQMITRSSPGSAAAASTLAPVFSVSRNLC